MTFVNFCVVFLLASLVPSSQGNPDAVVWHENVPIREDAPVGNTVKHLRDFVTTSVALTEEENDVASWSVNITSGNDFGRFEVVVENLTIIVAAPLDYEFYPRYNLSLELRNTGDNRVWFVKLAILVMDVSGYPPYYNKLCETPVIPANETTNDYIVWSSSKGVYDVAVNGELIHQYDDFFPDWRTDPHDATMKDCSLRLCVGFIHPLRDLHVFRPALKSPEHQGRIEFQCRDGQKSKGKVTILDTSLNDTLLLPEWALGGHCATAEGVSDVLLIDLNEARSTSSYRVRCGANVLLHSSMLFLEFIFQHDVTGCPEGRYGFYCDRNCVCKNEARCHGFNGACECRPGWRGRACDIPWPEVVIIASPGDSVVKYIGTNLTLTCVAPHIQVANMTWVYQSEINFNDTKMIERGAVQNSSIYFQPISESANGDYTCVVKATDGEQMNATFVLNGTKCPPNYHGKYCSQVCDCQYGGTCDRWEGCLCPTGRHGGKCDSCAPGNFGLNCSKNCNCQNNAMCDPVNGTCICVEGQSGEFCKNDVPKPENNQVVVKVLASVLPAMVIVGCIIIVTLVKKGGYKTVNTEVDIEIETLSSWEIDKQDIRFEHMIGEGEFGHVVRGRLRVPQGYEVLVAAKSIRPDRMTASAVRDFSREMDILARIHEDKEGHPNVVKFYGFLTKSEPQYIVVEYATNEELRRYLWTLREEYKVTGHRKLLERLDFASGVASGLSELARLKIVHRDIAARNVVISDRKVAKIADFGLSRDVYMSSAYEHTNQGGEEELLPLKWMAVESLRDGVYTCESDVWSYGVLLWEIASFGEEPRYAGGPMHPDVCTLLELLKKGVRLQQPENCPLSVYKIIRSCWIVDPSKRPTPEGLLQKIDQLMPQRHFAQSVP
ncbi:uncharacterized protein [Branchiostoma lanceolatum]|uniref:uncharacterized protein n=1 Tax=Branchiostoma lanceolatum TaxID=7740 RepID=UPI00345205B9